MTLNKLKNLSAIIGINERVFKKKTNFNFFGSLEIFFLFSKSYNMVKIKGNNLAIFGPFVDLQEIFKTRWLSFETSNSDFCDFLNELFFLREIKFSKVILKSHIKNNERFLYLISLLSAKIY